MACSRPPLPIMSIFKFPPPEIILTQTRGICSPSPSYDSNSDFWLMQRFFFFLTLFRLQLMKENHHGIRYRPPSINIHQLWSQEHKGNYVDPEN
jgi:hypothetical protein